MDRSFVVATVIFVTTRNKFWHSGTRSKFISFLSLHPERIPRPTPILRENEKSLYRTRWERTGIEGLLEIEHFPASPAAPLGVNINWGFARLYSLISVQQRFLADDTSLECTLPLFLSLVRSILVDDVAFVFFVPPPSFLFSRFSVFTLDFLADVHCVDRQIPLSQVWNLYQRENVLFIIHVDRATWLLVLPRANLTNPFFLCCCC